MPCAFSGVVPEAETSLKKQHFESPKTRLDRAGIFSSNLTFQSAVGMICRWADNARPTRGRPMFSDRSWRCRILPAYSVRLCIAPCTIVHACDSVFFKWHVALRNNDIPQPKLIMWFESQVSRFFPEISRQTPFSPGKNLGYLPIFMPWIKSHKSGFLVDESHFFSGSLPSHGPH